MSAHTRTSRLFEFMLLIGKLKATKRTGWVRRNVQQPESVADHMYRMAALSFLVDSKMNIAKDKCMKLALVHDMAECIVGDVTPFDGISKTEKHKMEEAAMTHIRNLLEPEQGDEIYNLWQEYELQCTAEAKFVKDLDQFDMILQAYEYEKSEQRPNDLQEFFTSTEGKFQSSTVQGWVDELKKMRSDGNTASNVDHESISRNKEVSTNPRLNDPVCTKSTGIKTNDPVCSKSTGIKTNDSERDEI